SAIKELGSQSSESGENQSFDRSQFKQMMNEASSLTLEEYQKYAEAPSVKDFYYTLTASVNGTDDFEPVSSQIESETQTEQQNEAQPSAGAEMPQNNMGKMKGGFSQSDFSITGYSNENAMTAFKDGTITVTDGEVFQQGENNSTCIISSELAKYNDLSVGDSINISNPNNEDETYKLKVVGIFTDSSSNESSFSPMSAASNDPANKIYTSYATLEKIIEESALDTEAETDEEAGTAISSSLSGTYVFADADAYNSFETEVRDMGLDEKYTVSSSDLNAYEASLTPLNSLSTMAGYFLIVILVIGAVILVVLNIFTVRERKYEIGVLTAMGMKKGKVALQFICETLIVTLIAVIIGAAVGGISSVPVTNALLENQVQENLESSAQVQENFGRGQENLSAETAGGKTSSGKLAGLFGQSQTSYVTEVSSAMNLTVLLELIAIALALVLLSGGVSLLFVMRYDPLKILANRD
ncbi:MAG: ABC transporter permease, partial [Acutalibacteraceae bacterium]